MATNPMQRKARNSFLLGMVITLILTGAVIAFLILQLKNYREKEANEQANSVKVWVLSQNVISGQVITTDMLTQQVTNKNLVPSNAIGDMSILSNYALTDKEGNEINLLDVIESAPVDIVEDCYIRENTDYLLRSLKKVLSDKEYQVICCRYGLFGMEEETQREIARKLCISRSYVSRIEKNALQKLRGLFPQMQ